MPFQPSWWPSKLFCFKTNGPGVTTWPEYLLPKPEDHCSDLQRSFKSQAYKNGGSHVIQSSGIHRARWKEIAKLCFIERPNLRTYGREQPRKIPRAMLWPLQAHTHTCTCTYIFVTHTRSCMLTNHAHMQNFALFLSIFPIFGAFQTVLAALS